MEMHLLRQQGLSIRQIAAVLNISRNAVRRALRSSAPPTGKRHRIKGAKLQAFTELIDGWMRDPVKSPWTAERIFDELKERGYEGGRTVVKEYVHAHRPRPAKPAEMRFYVRPGQQVQIDWAAMGVVSIDGTQRKLYVFVAHHGLVSRAVHSVHDRHAAPQLAGLPSAGICVLRRRAARGADRQSQDRR
jgi:transposase